MRLIQVVDRIRDILDRPGPDRQRSILDLAIYAEQEFKELFAHGTYTPTWQNAASETVSGGTTAGRYYRIASLMFLRITATVSASMTYPTAGSAWIFGYPTFVGDSITIAQPVVRHGSVCIEDNSASLMLPSICSGKSSPDGIGVRRWNVQKVGWDTADISDTNFYIDSAGSGVAAATDDQVVIETVMEINTELG